ncbi:hypothetical protein LR032_02265 [Candidatus Bipolaricaulota bacterium]|nr:hypothetical protein [Candidatus Bipolaricaulota bacterium]
MKLALKVKDNELPGILVEGIPWIRKIGVRVPLAGSWYGDADGGLTVTPWCEGAGADLHGAYREQRREYLLEGEPLLSFTLRAYERAIWATVEVKRDLDCLAQSDSFESPTLLAPTFSFAEDLSFFLATFGLGASGDNYPGGDWPTVHVGKGAGALPKEAFAPLVCFAEQGALAIAPANYFLTSPMVRTPDGAARGLHGSVNALSAGTRLETVFVFGDDLPSALIYLGDLLLARGGKGRPCPQEHLLTSSLGWWNAYGSYYTELIRTLNADELAKVVTGLEDGGVPLRYLGIDLWYPYQEIGQALRYLPDEKKYPHGLTADRNGSPLPTALHLSALSPDNEYGADGSDPSFYRTAAAELTAQRGFVAWHDWLRTQQHMTPALRSDPERAERWFSGMAEAFAAEDIDLLLCMQTMGMNLASTMQKNVISARSHTDFLFAQRAALATAAKQGTEGLADAWTPPGDLHNQNLLMGMVLYSLGMMPFHDLFLSRPHPGLGGENPEEEAVLRALSCGPVGIGDGPEMTDVELIERLVLADGTIAQPDRPPFPVTETLDSDIHAFWTVRQAGGACWIYYLVLNTAQEELPFSFDPPTSGDFLVVDGFTHHRTPGITGRLAPGRLAYFVLLPQRGGIGLLGLPNKFVPAPTGRIMNAQWDGGWKVQLQGVVDRFAVFSDRPISATSVEGRPVEISQKDGLWICEIEEEMHELFIRR